MASFPDETIGQEWQIIGEPAVFFFRGVIKKTIGSMENGIFTYIELISMEKISR